MCTFPSFPNFALFVYICQFEGFPLGAILVDARHRGTTGVLNGSPQRILDFALGYCCICGIWLLFRVEGGLHFLYFWILDPGIGGMQSLIRSKSAGVTGGRGTAGAGPGRDLLYGSRGVPAAPTYRRPGDLGPYGPCPSTPRVRIVDSVETTPEIGAIEEPRRSRAWRTPEVEARREVRHLGRGGLDMEDLVSMCERRCRKACNFRSAAEESAEACHSGSSGGRARRYRKRGSPKSAARDAGAMDTDPSPVRLWESEGTLRAIGQPMSNPRSRRRRLRQSPGRIRPPSPP